MRAAIAVLLCGRLVAAFTSLHATPKQHCVRSTCGAVRWAQQPMAVAAGAASFQQPVFRPDAAPPQQICYGPHIKIKGQVLSLFGAIYGIQAIGLGLLWSLSMALTWMVCSVTGWDKDRRFYDLTGKVWSRVNMWIGGCAPRVVTGKEYLPGGGGPGAPEKGEAVMLVANHGSWFDIPLIAQVAHSTLFKFIASKPLGKLPLIGQQLVGGKHVLIDRASRRGQLASFKESIAWLKNRVSLCVFPEGTRTKTGRLGKFKGGTFAMATKTGVPIIPVSIVGAYQIYPSNCLLPLRPGGRDLEVHLHPPIDPEGKSEEEIEELTRAAICSKLPDWAQPLD